MNLTPTQIDSVALFAALVAGERSGDFKAFDELIGEKGPFTIGIMLDVGMEYMVGPIWSDVIPEFYAKAWWIPPECYEVKR